MSVRDLPPELDETTAEPEDLTVRRLVRAIDYAEGFWLGFAKSNTPAQRRRLAAICKDLLEPLKIRVLEIELTEPITDLLPLLRERLIQEQAASSDDAPLEETTTPGEHPKLAIFVHGLERSIPSREAYPPLLSSLNLKRELFRQEVPHPLLLWLPDYALTALARKAPDFWAWRSGLYEFAPERESAEQSLKALHGEAIHVIDSLPKQAKRERLVMLKGLLDDYLELGDGPRELNARGNILNEIGLVHEALGEWADSERAYKESLSALGNIEDNESQASVLTNLAGVMYWQGEIEEPFRLYQESLTIAKKLGYERVMAGALHGLAMIARDQGDVEEARRLYEESVEIKRRLRDQSGVAITLHELGRLSQLQGEVGEARRLYGESLEIKHRLRDHNGAANTINNLGLLAEKEGDKMEAARLLREAVAIYERLGSPNVEMARRNLARVEDSETTST